MARLDPRNNTHMKHARGLSNEMRTKRDQTFSASKGSASKHGYYKSSQPVDEIAGMIRMFGASRRRNVKITLVKMPWDKEKSDG